MFDLLTAGIGKPCVANRGGIKKFYLWNYVEDPFTLTGRTATAINVDLTEVFEFDLIGDDHTLVAPLIGDFKTGNKTGTETLTTFLKGINETAQGVLDTAAGALMSGCVLDRNGNAIALGVLEGFSNITIDPNTGGASADVNGYNCTFVAESKNLPPVLDSATLTALQALVA